MRLGPDLGKSLLALGRREVSCVPQYTVLIPETQQKTCNRKTSQGKRGRVWEIGVKEEEAGGFGAGGKLEQKREGQAA